ncbi:MAG: pitrilysin family protein [Campylobacterota bacterium]|nr:pitrilysin family protein [Campylobacterota bacterium]
MNKILKTLLLTIIITQGMLMSATLKNINHNNTDIPVIFEKHNTLPIFNLQLVFQNSGYINDTKNAGITNITAKILNEGTSKDGAVNYARNLENNAISIHTSTGFETFVIEVSCLVSEKQQALKYLEQLLKDPNITKKTLNKIKNLQISKLKQKENDFDYVASKTLKKLTYKDTALENSSSGTQKSIENIKLKDIKNNLSNILNLDNLIIVVGGDIKLKEFSKDIHTVLNNIKPQGKTRFNKINISKKIENKIIKKDTQQSYIYFSSPFDIEVDSKDNYKSKVASFILGGSGFGSRLMEEIRVKHGLAYSAYGYITNKKSHSHFTGYLQTKLDNTTKAKNMVSSIVKEFVKNGVTQKELDAAKNFLSGSEPLRSETFSQRLNRAFHLYYQNLSFDYPKEELARINKLSLEDLNKFIKSHKEIENLSFSIVTK